MGDVELLDTVGDDDAVIEHEVTKKGIPRWLVVLPIVGIAVAAMTVGGSGSFDPETVPTDRSTTTAQPADEPTVTASPFGSRRIRGNEAERLGLVHGSHPYVRAPGSEGDHVVALRAGPAVIVIDSSQPVAHRIELPRSSSRNEIAGVTMAIVADKLIVADGSLLRSLSVQGGVDLLLANNLIGFQVDGPRLIVAANTSDPRFPNRKLTEIRTQGVHEDFFGVPGAEPLRDGARVVSVGGQVFVELGGQVLAPTGDGLKALHQGSVVAAGPNHAFVRYCDTEPETTEFSCEAVRVRLDGTEVVSVSDPRAFGAASYVVSPTGDQLLILNDGSGVQSLLRLEGEQWGVALEFPEAEITTAAFNSDGSMLITVTNNEISFWRGGEVVGLWTVDNFDAITEIVVAG